jgi:hypothetical protein
VFCILFTTTHVPHFLPSQTLHSHFALAQYEKSADDGGGDGDGGGGVGADFADVVAALHSVDTTPLSDDEAFARFLQPLLPFIFQRNNTAAKRLGVGPPGHDSNGHDKNGGDKNDGAGAPPGDDDNGDENNNGGAIAAAHDWDAAVAAASAAASATYVCERDVIVAAKDALYEQFVTEERAAAKEKAAAAVRHPYKSVGSGKEGGCSDSGGFQSGRDAGGGSGGGGGGGGVGGESSIRSLLVALRHQVGLITLSSLCILLLALSLPSNTHFLHASLRSLTCVVYNLPCRCHRKRTIRKLLVALRHHEGFSAFASALVDHAFKFASKLSLFFFFFLCFFLSAVCTRHGACNRARFCQLLLVFVVKHSFLCLIMVGLQSCPCCQTLILCIHSLIFFCLTRGGRQLLLVFVVKHSFSVFICSFFCLTRGGRQLLLVCVVKHSFSVFICSFRCLTRVGALPLYTLARGAAHDSTSTAPVFKGRLRRSSPRRRCAAAKVRRRGGPTQGSMQSCSCVWQDSKYFVVLCCLRGGWCVSFARRPYMGLDHAPPSAAEYMRVARQYVFFLRGIFFLLFARAVLVFFQSCSSA